MYAKRMIKRSKDLTAVDVLFWYIWFVIVNYYIEAFYVTSGCDDGPTFSAEDAIEKIGFGKFQVKVLAMIGFAWVSNMYFVSSYVQISSVVAKMARLMDVTELD